MALDSRTGLKKAVLKWSLADDIDDEDFKEFINLVESDISRELRVPTMERRQKISVANGALGLPPTLLEIISLSYNTPDGRTIILERGGKLRQNQSAERRKGHTEPHYYHREGSQLLLDATLPDGTEFELVYYTTIPSIREPDSETSFVLSVSPEVYLYGVLSKVFERGMDIEKASYWENKFMKSLFSLQNQANRAKWAGTTMAIRGYDE